MRSCRKTFLDATIQMLFLAACPLFLGAQAEIQSAATRAVARSRFAVAKKSARPTSDNYNKVQQRLAREWNTWDVNSLTTHVLLPGGYEPPWIFMGLGLDSALNAKSPLARTQVARVIQGKSAHNRPSRNNFISRKILSKILIINILSKNLQ